MKILGILKPIDRIKLLMHIVKFENLLILKKAKKKKKKKKKKEKNVIFFFNACFY